MKTRRRRTSVKWVAVKRFLALLVIGSAFSQIGIAQCEGKQQGTEPRTLEILDVGYGLPIEIVALRNFQCEHWVRELELEMRNVSDKPIYGVYITLYLPDDKGEDGHSSIAVTLEYGRSDLLHPRHRPSPDDRPIAPGETAALKVDARISRGYEHHVKTKNVPKQASYDVRMIVTAINFGDGTGFINGGVPYPTKPQMAPRPQRYVKMPVQSK